MVEKKNSHQEGLMNPNSKHDQEKGSKAGKEKVEKGVFPCATCGKKQEGAQPNMNVMGYLVSGGASAALGFLLIIICKKFFFPFLIWLAASAGFYWFYCR